MPPEPMTKCCPHCPYVEPHNQPAHVCQACADHARLDELEARVQALEDANYDDPLQA